MVENVLKKRLDKKPENHNAMWILANFYVWHEKYAEALGLLELLLKSKPDSRGVIMLLARVCFNLGQYEYVTQILSSSGVLSDKDKENYYLGDSLIEIGRFREGINYLKKYAQRYSKDYLVFVRLGYAYYKEGLYEDALKAYQRAAILSPGRKEIQDSIYLCSEKLTSKTNRSG
jgi:tetratricopeptide (TPR) repeat protein